MLLQPRAHDVFMGGVTMSVVLPSDEELESLEGRELDEALSGLEQIRRRVEHATGLVVDRCDRTGHFVADGHRSPRGWAMAITNCSPGEATRRHRTASVLQMLPAVRAELRAGRIGVAQVHLLAKLAANPRCRDQLPGSERVLLDTAQQLQFEDFKIVCQRWEQLADADGAHRDHERSLQHRNASIVEVDGEFELRSRQAAVQGAMMREIFQKFCEAQYRADWEATVAEHGDRARPELMPRTGAQRRADALMAIFEAAATAGIDGVSLEIVLNLVMDHDQFEQYTREQLDATPVAIDPATVRQRRCETVDGVPVDPRQAVALAFLGQVRRIVVDGTGVVVNAGRLRRLFTGSLRDVLQVIEPRCIWLGCTIRAAISQIDHLRSHAAGGPTDAANAGVMCRHHNLFKYRNGYHARRDHQGVWHITRPDGTHLRPPHAA
jgi:hypothetical protein